MKFEQVVFPVFRRAAKSSRAMGVMDRVLKPWNPFSPQRWSDPYPLYEQVRSAGPVNYQRSTQIWNVAGYEECEQVLRSPHASVDRRELIELVRPYTKLLPTSRELFLSTMLMTDPPDHGRLRTLVNRAFTPRAVNALEPQVEKIARDLLHDMAKSSVVDATSAFADQLPIFVISEMLGLPRSEWDRFKAISDQLVRFIDPISGFEIGAMESAIGEFRGLVAGLVREREDNPRDDMLTALLDVEEDGDRLSRTELESMVALLMVAGHETTSGLIGNSLLALRRFPAAAEQLAAEPDLAANAVEELIRFDSPVQSTDRTMTEAVDIDGHRIAAGQTAVLLLGAANRDPRRYDRPNELLLDRPDPRPLSFGHGIHHCLGAALARLEARVAIPVFLETFPGYEVDEANVVWKRSMTVRGPSQLPVRLR